MTVRVGGHRGVALVIALIAVAAFSTLAAGIALSSIVGRGIATNDRAAIELANASESALELAARDLAAIDDWNEVLNGVRTSALVDGAPGARVLADGRAIDLPALTSELSCGRAGMCSDMQIAQMTADRPWGANNPHWRLFLHTAFPALPAMPRPPPAAYVVAWVGDDARETDDDPRADGAGVDQKGRYVVRIRVETFGLRGGRHALEAELARVCSVDEGVETCLPGVRLQSWRAAAATP